MSKCVKDVGYITVDIKKELIDRIKDDHKELGGIMVAICNTALSSKRSGDILSKQKNSQAVFIGTEDLKRFEKVAFHFECYDVDNEEHEKIFLEKLDPEDRKIYDINKSLKGELKT